METLTRRARRAMRAYGRRVAVRHLAEAGLQILDRSWQCRAGRIDVVARDGGELVFCAVVTSLGGGGDGDSLGAPATAPGLRPVARRWLATAGEGDVPVRYDVVSVVPQPRGAAQVQHHRQVG